ncbi:MAG: undecaprenyl-diphosphatase UppP [bacterium]|nr:undecaprenyl-diphosphatase UppP [bacterium]
MSITDAIILGVVEGVTEFLPVSSTGHLMLASEVLGLHTTEFLKTFEISIQLGAVAAVVFLYWRSLFTDFNIIKRIIVAFIPTGVLGLALYSIVKDVFLESNTLVLYALFIGGVALILFESWHLKFGLTRTQDIANIPLWQAALVGVFQSLAFIPGVSRSAATIVGGLALGVSRQTIVEFSFLLAVPTMLAATGVELVQNSGAFHIAEIHLLLVGMLISFVVAVVSITFLLAFVRKHSFVGFGVYRILIAIIFWATLT